MAYLFPNFVKYLTVKVISPKLLGFYGLVPEHSETVKALCALFFGLGQKRGLLRIIYAVKGIEAFKICLSRKGGLPFKGAHAYGRGVDD